MASLTLQLLTREESIGLDGFKFLLDSIRKHRKKFERMFKEDPLFGARIGYQIDTTFQTFCLETTKYVDDRYPLDGTHRDLVGSMEDEYDDIMRVVRRGYRSNLIRPLALSESQGSTHEDDHPRAKRDLGNRGAADGDPKAQAALHMTNPNPQESWGLPSGKKF
jgi:predicted RNA methylase